MSNPERFANEIAAKVAAWDAAGKELHPQWITHEICEAHKEGIAKAGDDADFYRHFAYKACRKDVGAFITKNYGDELKESAAEREPPFPNFPRIQRRYVVNRNGDDVAVLAIDMTDDELDAKELFLTRRSAADIEHADEIRRFKHWRKTLKKAAAE